MSSKKTNSNESQIFSLVPSEVLSELLEAQNKIISLLSGSAERTENSIGDYITEPEAKRLLDRRATWFWAMRKSGKLPFSKVGNKIFYKRTDLIQLIDKFNSKRA